jgi:hypothetical protein
MAIVRLRRLFHCRASAFVTLVIAACLVSVSATAIGRQHVPKSPERAKTDCEKAGGEYQPNLASKSPAGFCLLQPVMAGVSGGVVVPEPATYAPWQAEIRSTYVYTAADIANDTKLPVSSPDKFYLREKETWERQHRCGGVYIGDGWILTAAHCVTSVNPVDSFLKARRVRLGAFDLSERGPDFAIETAVVNKGYDPSTGYTDDIALLKLGMRPGESVNGLEPANLPRSDQDSSLRSGESVYVTGWGATEPTQGGQMLLDLNGQPLRASPLLKMAELKVVPNSQCGHVEGYEGTIGGSVLCAESERPGTDACTWDSGGPLVRASDYMLVGIVSRGKGCGLAGVPGVYTRVSKYLDWINRAKRAPAGRVTFM